MGILKKCRYKPENDGFTEDNGKNKLQEFFTVIFNFIKAHYHYFVTAPLIFVTFLIILAIYKVYPFGRYSISSYDMLAQIAPFIEHLFDVIEGKSSLFYSTAIVGGADVFGTIAYCMISPFIWIFLLFGKGNVYYGTGIVLPLKLICISFSALYFIGKNYTKIPKHIRIVVSILYAYCGYMFVANTYINWLDFLIYMPFVVNGFIKIVREGKILYFAISYALMIYACFSIACFALFIIFPIIFCYTLFNSENQREVLVKSCLGLLLAIAFSLPLMVPALFAYLKSGRNTGLFENINKPLDSLHLYRKVTYILSDAIFLFLSFCYFIKHGVKRPIDRFLLVTGILLLMPVLIDECCNLLNAGSYMSYSLRFGFLNGFYVFYLSINMLSEVYEEEALNDTIPDLKRPTRKSNIITGIVLGILCAGVIAYFICTEAIIKFIDKIYQAAENDSSYNFEFYNVFAHSLGGLEFIAPMAVAIVVAMTAGTIFYKKKLLSLKITTLILSSIFAAQFALYNVSLVDGNYFNPIRYDQYAKIVDAIKENGNDENTYYRIKDTADALTADAPFTTHTNSYSVFSSVIDRRNFAVTDFFNYKGNGVNSIKSANGMFLGDMILGYKYYYHHEDRGKLTTHKKAIDRFYITKPIYGEEENFSCYINRAVFPNAYTVNGGDLDFEGLNYRQQLDKLYNFLGGEGNLCDAYTIKYTDNAATDIEILDDGGFKLSLHIKTYDSEWFLQEEFPEDFDVYYCFSSYYKPESEKKLNGEIKLGYSKGNAAHWTVTIIDHNNKMTVEDIQKYCKMCGVQVRTIYDPDDDDEELYDTVWKNKVDYTITGGNTFNANVYCEDEQYLFLNYIYLDGHTATVNGKKAELIENSLNFMIVKLEKGENNVVIKYRSPYIKYGIFGLIGGLLITFAVLFILKKQKVYNLFEKIIYIAAIILFIGVTGFFFIYPTSVFLPKLAKLLIGLF